MEKYVNPSRFYNTQGLEFLYYGSKCLGESLKYFNLSIKYNSNNGLAYANRAAVYAAMSDFHSSLLDYNKALNCSVPLQVAYVIYSSRAIVYHFLENYQNYNQDMLNAKNTLNKFKPTVVNSFVCPDLSIHIIEPFKVILILEEAIKKGRIIDISII